MAIFGISIGGANPTDFLQTNNCPAFVAVGGNCVITVTFKPTVVGARGALLTVSSNVPTPLTVALSGTAVPPQPPSPVSVTPATGGGLTQTFATVYTDPNGLADLTQVQLLFNTTVNSAAACYVIYNTATNQLFLRTDAGTANLTTAIVPGSGVKVSNSQCTLLGVGSSVSTSGNNLTLNIALTFAATYTGTKNIYMQALGIVGSSGWVLKGTWTPAAVVVLPPPTVVSVTPASGAGFTQTFSAVYSDPNGLADLTQAQLLINSSVNSAAACYVIYNTATNQLFLRNDAGTANLATAVTPGSAGSVANSQCTLFGTGSSVIPSGNTLTLNVNLTFAGTFTGSKRVYLQAVGKTSNSGWVQKGTWTP